MNSDDTEAVPLLVADESARQARMNLVRAEVHATLGGAIAVACLVNPANVIGALLGQRGGAGAVLTVQATGVAFGAVYAVASLVLLFQALSDKKYLSASSRFGDAP